MTPFIRTATFNCPFCRFSTTATVSAEIGGAQDAFAATYCPQCRRRIARPLVHGIVGGLCVAFCVLVHLLELTRGRCDGWMIVVALGTWAIIVALSLAHARRRQREVVFLPTATALTAPRRIKA